MFIMEVEFCEICMCTNMYKMCNISYFLIYLYMHAVLEFGSEEVQDKCNVNLLRGK